MKRILIFSLFTFFVINQNVFSQNWKSLNRQQKDSIVYNHFNKGNKRIGLIINGGLLGGGWGGFSYDIGLSYGKFINKRHLMAANVEFKKGKMLNEDFSHTHKQYTIGAFYRYYLHERKTYTAFFAHGEIETGVFCSRKITNNEENNSKFAVLNMTIGFGISIPINKFNIEIGMKQELRIINQSKYYNNYSFSTDGIIGISYIF